MKISLINCSQQGFHSLLIGLTLLLTACGPTLAEPDLLIKNVSIFDAETGQVHTGQSVFVDGGIITDIKPTQEGYTARSIIEGKERLLTPGLIDTHVHFQHQYYHTRMLHPSDRARLARVYLRYGVTTVAEMGQPQAWVPTLVEWEANPSADSPNVVLVAGALGTKHDWDRRPPPHHVLLGSPEEARLQVQRYHGEGAKRLKLYWKLEQPEMQAIIFEADRLGLRYYGHIDNGFVPIQTAMHEGLRDFEHFFTLQRSIEDPDTLIEMMNSEFGFQGQQNIDEWTLSLSLYHDVIERTPELRNEFDALINRMAKNGASVSTTLNMMVAAAGKSSVYSQFDPVPLKREPRLRENFISQDRADAAIDSVLAQLKRAHEAGGLLRIGTDASNGGQVTLAEMRLLAENGFPTEDVLQIATINGAKALGISDKAGLIAIGRPADLVLFDQNPFDDSEHFMGGMTVIKDGQVYHPTQSPARHLSEYLDASNDHDVEGWLKANEPNVLQPADVADEFFRLIPMGDIDLARDMYAAISLNLRGEVPSDYISENALLAFAYTLLQNDRATEAVDLFKLATDIFPDSWNAHDSLGEAYIAAGKLDEARLSYSRSLEINPESATGQKAIETLNNPE